MISTISIKKFRPDQASVNMTLYGDPRGFEYAHANVKQELARYMNGTAK
jgi:hypothetical protein